MTCEGCRLLICGEADNQKLARKIETQFPHGHCEAHSIGEGSPGVVSGDETAVRIIISPRDYDPVIKRIAQKPFEKVFANGLSVMRSIGTKDDFLNNAEDGLWSKANTELRQVLQICELSVADLKGELDPDGQPMFSIYDQTVPRRNPDLPPVPTHAGIFQNKVAVDIDGAKKANKDKSIALYKLFLEKSMTVEQFKDHLFQDLNARAALAEFVTD